MLSTNVEQLRLLKSLSFHQKLVCRFATCHFVSLEGLWTALSVLPPVLFFFLQIQQVCFLSQKDCLPPPTPPLTVTVSKVLLGQVNKPLPASLCVMRGAVLELTSHVALPIKGLASSRSFCHQSLWPIASPYMYRIDYAQLRRCRWESDRMYQVGTKKGACWVMSGYGFRRLKGGSGDARICCCVLFPALIH